MKSAPWDPGLYDSTHNYVFEYGRGLLDILAPKAGEAILDVGCGTGHLSHEIASTGAEIVGIDSSPEMIAQARQNYPKLKFQLSDVSAFRSERFFDAVFSNAVLHWIREPEPAIAAFAAALKPGGRFVAEFGGHRNVASVVAALGRNQWYFPTIGEYASLLERHGFEVSTAALFDRPTKVDGESGMHEWLTMFLKPTPSEAEINRMVDELRPKLYRDGAWWLDYRRLRITAYRP